VIDVPYNGDPELVQPVGDARESLERLRAAGVRVGVLTNQSGVGRGMITEEQMRAVNARIDALLGPFDGWFICPHAPEDECECRKPKPKLVFDAAAAWGIDVREIVVVGDKKSDADVAYNAGAAGILIESGSALAPIVAQILED
jgi:D-glycero-D-manno-heptose 1,7-bisphosphate phosphatase